MQIFLDTNIFLDVLSGRSGFLGSLKVLNLVEEKKITGYYSVISIPIIWYLQKGVSRSREKIRAIVKKCRPVALTPKMTNQVLQKLLFGDLEDELQYLAAKKMNCQYLITRNIADFKKVKDIKVLSPEKFLLEI